MAAFKHNDIGILAARLDELLVHGLDGRQILRDDALERAAAVAHVGVGLDKNFDVKHFAQPRVLENEDALDDDDLARPDELGLIRALVVGVGVDGAADGLARLELLKLLDHQIGLESVGVVVVLFAALFKGPVLIFIIAVVVHDADIVAEVLLMIFAPGQTMLMVISAIGLVLFAGMTVYDAQATRALFAQYAGQGEDMVKKVSIICALNLYLDFINMFLYILQLFGDRD